MCECYTTHHCVNTAILHSTAAVLILLSLLLLINVAVTVYMLICCHCYGVNVVISMQFLLLLFVNVAISVWMLPLLCVNDAIVIWLMFDTVCNVAVIVCNGDVNIYSYMYSLSNKLYQRNLHGGTRCPPPPPDHIQLMPPLVWMLLCVCKCCYCYSHEFVTVCDVGAS